MTLITDHVWRPVGDYLKIAQGVPRRERPCEFMNCRRKRDDHQSAVERRGRWA